LANELAGLRARVDEVERRLPPDTRSSGVYPHVTRDGVLWRIAVTRPDGTVTTRRGFTTHAAACQARDRLAPTAPADPEMSFGLFWRAWLAAKQPYLTERALEDLDAHGRKRLLPHLAHLSIATLSEPHVREWLAAMTEQHDAGAVSAKTPRSPARSPTPHATTCWTATRANSSRRSPPGAATCGTKANSAGLRDGADSGEQGG
jgi:hypothetical protein